MGKNAMQGSFGIGLQAVKGTAAGTIRYIQSSSVSVNPEQAATSLGPEVGGGLWSQTSYKTGVMVTGEAAFNARTDSFGYLMRAFVGSASSGVNGAGGYSHSFFEAADVANIPYCTVSKNVSDIWAERYVDCRVDSARVEIPAAGIITGTLGFVGITPSEISPPTETFDASPLFETSTTGSSLKLGGSSTIKATAVTLDFSNNISRDEQVIGSYYLEDVSLVRRACRISFTAFLQDAAWYRQVYNNGSTSWDPAIFSTDMDLTIMSSRHVVGSVHGMFRLVIPNLDYLVMPIQLQGNDIIRVNVSAELTLVGGGTAFYVEMINNQSNYSLT